MVNHILSTWQKQLMASDHNLIDFSDEGKGSKASTGATPTTEKSSSMAPSKSTSDNPESNSDSGTVTSKQQGQGPNKPNKSLFEITRVESNHVGSIGGEDSEMDDSVTSSTSVLEQISKELESDKKEITLTIKTKPLDIKNESSNTNVIASISNTTDQQITVQQSNNALTTITQTKTQTIQPTEPSSRFRIVKIAKQIPYERGTWMVNDFNDSQKQQQQESSTDTTPSSPLVKRNRNPASENGGVTSPTEPVVSKSSEFLAQNLSNTQSRGSSYNTSGDRRSSVESTAVSESGSGTPMVEALQVALDQIQTIRDSMLTSVSDEVRKHKDQMEKVMLENLRLKEENESLKKRLAVAEERIVMLEKG